MLAVRVLYRDLAIAECENIAAFNLNSLPIGLRP